MSEENLSFKNIPYHKLNKLPSARKNVVQSEAKRIAAEQKKQEKLNQIEEENRIRKEKAAKALKYLLQNTAKFSQHFVNTLKLQDVNSKPDVNFNKAIKKSVNTENETKNVFKTPKYFVGTLHKYQFEGLNWLKLLYENSVNGILADEMGLGKTIQTIALICHLIESKIPGPFLIVAPLSTLPNWVSEFKKFAPKIPVVLFRGDSSERAFLLPKILKSYSIDGFQTRPVVITNYHTIILEKKMLRPIKWHYLTLDEGHLIKNSQSKIFNELKKLKTENRLILTGTPLQNNLLELWALLNFLLPQFFQNQNAFGDLFEISDFAKSDTIIKQEQDNNIISTIHGVLSPFMLRRLKSDVLIDLVPKKDVLVYCPLSEFQEELYRYVLQKNIKELLGQQEENIDFNQPRKRRRCIAKNAYIESDSETEYKSINKFVEDSDFDIDSELIKNPESESENEFEIDSEVKNNNNKSELKDESVIDNSNVKTNKMGKKKIIAVKRSSNEIESDSEVKNNNNKHESKDESVIESSNVKTKKMGKKKISAVKRSSNEIESDSEVKNNNNKPELKDESVIESSNVKTKKKGKKKISAIKRSYNKTESDSEVKNNNNKPESNDESMIDSSDVKSKNTKILGKKEISAVRKSYNEIESDEEFKIDIPVKSSFVKNLDKKRVEFHRNFKLANPHMILRKICNHPFTVQCPVIPGTKIPIVDENIVMQSGKMMVLDALLNRLKAGGHKVLIFSAFIEVLDFIEDYLNLRNYGFCRFDGRDSMDVRSENINSFNDDPNKFVFLITTRTGGLGLNLTAADTVITFDLDWNPQADIQAQGRCHRIGQTRPVVLYSLVCKGTVDDYIFLRASAKRRLEKVVLKKDFLKSVADLKALEEFLNTQEHKLVIHSNGFALSNEELDRLLDRSDLYKQMNISES